MKKSFLWLFALVVISTMAAGSVFAGSGVRFTPVADDSYVMMCDDAGDVADTGMVLAQMKIERGSSNMTTSPAVPKGAGGNKMKAAGPSVQKIEKGGCCAKVGGGCVSWCNKSGGCTGNADCDTFKSN